MPKYDQGPSVKYDQGLRYDETDNQPTTTTNRSKKMNKIRRNWTRLPIGDRVASAQNVVACCTGNANVPPGTASFTALKTSTEAAAAAIELLTSLEAQVRVARADAAAKVDTMVGDLNTHGSFVEASTAGDIAKMLTTGYEVTGVADGPGTAAVMTQVRNLVLTAGDHDGEVDASWNSIPNTRLYQLQISTSTTPADETQWKDYGVPQSRSSLALTGLVSGTRVWVRVRSLGAGDTPPGAWSEYCHRMTP